MPFSFVIVIIFVSFLDQSLTWRVVSFKNGQISGNERLFVVVLFNFFGFGSNESISEKGFESSTFYLNINPRLD